MKPKREEKKRLDLFPGAFSHSLQKPTGTRIQRHLCLVFSEFRRPVKFSNLTGPGRICSLLKALGTELASVWLVSSLRSHVASEKRLFIVSDLLGSACTLTRREGLYIWPGGRDKLSSHH